jgi:hypothetical protein
MPNVTDSPPDAKLDVVLESILFLVRHSPVPNLADALIADLHRTLAQDPARKRVIDEIAHRLRERDEFVAEDDA